MSYQERMAQQAEENGDEDDDEHDEDDDEDDENDDDDDDNNQTSTRARPPHSDTDDKQPTRHQNGALRLLDEAKFVFLYNCCFFFNFLIFPIFVIITIILNLVWTILCVDEVQEVVLHTQLVAPHYIEFVFYILF